MHRSQQQPLRRRGRSMRLERRIQPAGCGRSSRLMVCTVLALAFSSACGNAQSGVTPHTAVEPRVSQQAPHVYAVNWHPSLLKFVDPRARADNQQGTLEVRLRQAWEDALQITNGQRTVEARCCLALLDLDATYETVVPSEFNVFQDLEAQCRAAALLVRAQPSKTSFLHAFALDAQAPNRLPAAHAFTVSPEEELRVSQAAARGESWSAVEDVHLVGQVSADEARFGANASEQTLTILGHGDVNGDGVEDLLLLNRGRLTEGSLKGTRLLVLTQVSDKARTMRLLPMNPGEGHPG
jgi:hypothetical protein